MADGERTLREISRRELMRGLGLGGLALATPGLLAACGEGGDEGASAGAPVSGGRGGEVELLTWATAGEITNLDIVLGGSATAATASALVLEGLQSYDADNVPRPALATELRQVDDVTYEYTLRRGVTFSDGSPLSVEDVVWSLQRAADPERSQVAQFFDGTKSIRAVGDDVVRITRTEPLAFFDTLAASWGGFIYNRAQTERAGSRAGTASAPPIGTGPYVVTRFETGREVVLERNERYWGEKPRARRVVIRGIEEDATRLLAARSGEISGTFDVSQQQLPQWERLDGMNVERGASQLRILQFNFSRDEAPFSDIHVRRAIAHCVDKEGLVRTVLRGLGTVAPAQCPRDQWGDVLPPDEVDAAYARLPTFAYDLDAARRELAQSSVPRGFEFTVPMVNTRQEDVNAAQAIAESLRQIGVTMRIRELNVDAWIEVMTAAEKQPAVLWSPGPDYPDPANNLFLVFHSRFARKNAYNVAGYRNPELDAILDRQLRTTDRRRRAQLLLEGIALLQRDVGCVPIWDRQFAVALEDGLALRDVTAFYFMYPWVRGLRAAA